MRNRIVWFVPVPVLPLLGFFVLAGPFILLFGLLFKLGGALFKWRRWCGWCYTAATATFLVWGVAWLQEKYDVLRIREAERVVLHKPARVINGYKHVQRRAGNARPRQARVSL